MRIGGFGIISRRAAIIGGLCAPLVPAAAQFTPLFLTIIRQPPIFTGAMQVECVPGSLFVGEPVFNVPANGIPSAAFCKTVELPYRNNLSDISSIPAGVYSGNVKTGPTADGRNLGWRIELADTLPRLGVQIHVGNAPANSTGCILVGRAGSVSCLLRSSAATVSALRLLYGSNLRRPINIRIV